MSHDFQAARDRWEELKAAELLFGLSEEEQTELAALSHDLPADEVEQLDYVVAALDATWTDAMSERLPDHLRIKVLQQAEQTLALPGERLSLAPPATSSGEPRSQQYLPWFVAAASLAFAAFLWFAQRPATEVEANVAQLRADLVASAPDLVQASWTAGPTPIAGATGDVVWSSQLQQGFMRFQGLTVNAPTKEQYQLWIFDKNQSDKTPIDGGVFDIRTPGETVVPIDAKLRVQEAFMFAVTIEKPGGVVVSSRERLPLLAKVD